jgi:nucleotide-binding universal stress UspA family protein
MNTKPPLEPHEFWPEPHASCEDNRLSTSLLPIILERIYFFKKMTENCISLSENRMDVNQFKKILIPTDGSDKAKVGVAKGLELAKMMNAEVTAISIVDIDQLAYSAAGPNSVDLLRFLELDANAAVDYVRKKAEEMGIVVKTLVKRGHAANEIIEVSKDYDLIVMNHLGHSGLSQMLIGGVAEKVVRFAYCPVLVIRVRPDEKN